jgi:hypothetical protein
MITLNVHSNDIYDATAIIIAAPPSAPLATEDL